jgi:hypothetical protein
VPRVVVPAAILSAALALTCACEPASPDKTAGTEARATPHGEGEGEEGEGEEGEGEGEGEGDAPGERCGDGARDALELCRGTSTFVPLDDHRAGALAVLWSQDGIDDVVVPAAHAAVVLMSAGDPGLFSPIELLVEGEVSALAVGDVDGDGDAGDIAIGTTEPNELALFRRESLEPPTVLSIAGTPAALVLADWTRDGRPDLVYVDRESGAVRGRAARDDGWDDEEEPLFMAAPNACAAVASAFGGGPDADVAVIAPDAVTVAFDAGIEYAVARFAFGGAEIGCSWALIAAGTGVDLAVPVGGALGVVRGSNDVDIVALEHEVRAIASAPDGEVLVIGADGAVFFADASGAAGDVYTLAGTRAGAAGDYDADGDVDAVAVEPNGAWFLLAEP